MRNLPIRFKLITAFLIVALVASSNLIVKRVYENKLEEIWLFTREVELFKTLILSDAKAQSDFVSIDLISPRFFITETSMNLDDHQRFHLEMQSAIASFRINSLSDDPRLKATISELDLLSERYDNRFEKLVETALDVGFKDYGLTGEMRDYAHRVEEQYRHLVTPEEILTLRRHEKDFLIRREEKYGTLFDNKAEAIIQRLSTRPENSEITECILLLQNYHSAFKLVRRYHLKMGLNTLGGIKGELDEIRASLLENSDQLILLTETISGNYQRQLKLFFLLSLLLTTAVTVGVVLYLSRLMSKSIAQLSESIQVFVSSHFTSEFKVQRFENRKDEIGSLYHHFKKLGEEITVHFKNYRLNAERKHKEILEKNEKIEDQKNLLESQRNQLSQKNKSLMDSILYARRIQSALFPPAETLKNLLGDYMLIFKPKDIVSGDFYWVEETADSVYFAVADCTGHGVPGAFMSILGYNYLNQALKEMNLKGTGEILDYLNESISSLLNQQGSHGEVKDGMDIALCRWIKNEKILEYSGANRPLVIIRNGDAIVHPSDRLPIGWMFQDDRSPFSSTEVTLIENDLIYLFSDGYCDQFGGEKNKKFKMSNFKATLSETNPLSAESNEKLIAKRFFDWKGKNEQIDDICVLGLSSNHLLQMQKELKLKSITSMPQVEQKASLGGAAIG